MIIKSIHIENFGKLVNKDISFEGTLTPFMHENGWGKTTLATFIKAMLYGMPDKNAHSKGFSEREKYKPWAGGRYGGYLTFIYDGKEYKVVRFFGGKKKEDTLDLYDTLLGQPCDALKDSDEGTLGEKLFKVDCDTFERSVFVTLDDDKCPQISTNISTKLNNLLENNNDLSNYDNAAKSLDEAIVELKAKRGKGGFINELDEKIRSANNQLVTIATEENAVTTLQKMIATEREGIAKEKKLVGGLQKLFASSEKYAKKNNYDGLKKQEVDSLQEQKQLSAFFNGAVPEASVVDAVSENYKQYAQYETLLKNEPVSNADRTQYETLVQSFNGHIPTVEQITACQKDAEKNDKLKQELNKYKLSGEEETELAVYAQKFAGKHVSNEIIDTYFSNADKVQALNTKSVELNAAKNSLTVEISQLQSVKPKDTMRTVSFAIAVVAALIGVFVLVGAALHMSLFASSSSYIFGGAAMVLALLCFIIGVAKKPQKQDCSAQTAQLSKVNTEIAQCESQKQMLENEYRSFIAQVAPEATSASVSVALSNIKREWGQYEALCKKESTFTAWVKTQPVSSEEYEKKIRSFEVQYAPNQSTALISEVLDGLRSRVDELATLSKRIATFDQNKEALAVYETKLQQALAPYSCNKSASYEKQITELREKLQQYKLVSEQLVEMQKQVAQFEKENDVAELAKVEKPTYSVDELNAQIQEEQRKIDDATARISDSQKKINDFVSDIDMRQSIENSITCWTEEKAAAET